MSYLDCLQLTYLGSQQLLSTISYRKTTIDNLVFYPLTSEVYLEQSIQEWTKQILWKTALKKFT